MISKLTVNPTTGKLQKINVLPQLDYDPDNPKAEDAWILKRVVDQSSEGAPLGGLLLCMTHAEDSTSYTYDYSFQTHEGTTLRLRMEVDEPYTASKLTTESGEVLTTEDGEELITE